MTILDQSGTRVRDNRHHLLRLQSTISSSTCILLLLAMSSVPALAQTPGAVKTNSKDGLRYVWVPPGTNNLGCSLGDASCDVLKVDVLGNEVAKEAPRHTASFEVGFWMGQIETTVGAFKKFAKTAALIVDDYNSDNRQPVIGESWEHARRYCNWAGGRLPTEEEWEYAARAGTQEPYYGPLEDIAWFDANSRSRQWPHRGAQKKPNAFNLYDMLGNVYEFVDDKYPAPPDSTRPGYRPRQGFTIVSRGGSFRTPPIKLRVSHRLAGMLSKTAAGVDGGFRCVLEPGAIKP